MLNILVNKISGEIYYKSYKKGVKLISIDTDKEIERFDYKKFLEEIRKEQEEQKKKTEREMKK